MFWIIGLTGVCGEKTRWFNEFDAILKEGRSISEIKSRLDLPAEIPFTNHNTWVANHAERSGDTGGDLAQHVLLGLCYLANGIVIKDDINKRSIQESKIRSC
jgi:hypothetical protein